MPGMCSSNDTCELGELALLKFYVTGNVGNCIIWNKKMGIHLIALCYYIRIISLRHENSCKISSDNK